MTPRDRLPFAMGMLLLAVYGGNTIGPALGGVMADAFGFRLTFFITGGLLALGGVIVLLFVKEDFERPEPGHGASLKDLVRLAGSRDILPLLLVIGALNLGPGMMSPIIPLFIAELGAANPAAATSGLAFAIMGVIAACSAIVAGRLARRISLTKMLVFCCVGTGLLYLPPLFAHSPIQLVLFVSLTGLLTGGIVTASNSLVGLSVPLSSQGAAYGLSQSASSLGGGLGPLLGGGIAPVIGLRSVFGVAGGLYVAVGALATAVLARRLPQRPV
jgi:DHA1 family multidrug resistance protein-like MFS transporter